MDKYEKYALLAAQISDLEDQKELLKNEIIEDMSQRGSDSEKHGMGKFTVSKVKRWTYSARIVEAEDQLKADKAKAQDTGEATCEESNSLRFTPIKI